MGNRVKKNKNQVRAWLKGKKHKAANVDTEVTSKTIEAALLILHGVDALEYRRAGGKGA